MSPKGVERYRVEGYLPPDEFQGELIMGLARVAFMAKTWAEAEKWYADVAENFPQTGRAPEAIYWRGVCRYKASNDHTVLGPTAEALRDRYPDSVWTKKASVWLH